ncbi:MAG: Gfo/Idh/MocA family protein [Planctomycetota bacterium]|jgi:predicted dehydrogenase
MGISIGLVGLGEFGSGFAELFKAHPLVDRVGLCDREPERMEAFAKRGSWRDKFDRKDMYGSHDDICRSDLDALAVITQPWLHAPQCIQAMESGKHVYSAVPIISLPDGDEILEWCDRLVETCRRTGMQYMLGETTYYRPQAMYCRRRAAEGAFGRFTYSEGEYHHAFDWPFCDLREVMKSRLAGRAGEEWAEVKRRHADRGARSGPMHYPTHSTSGPMCVMNAHAAKVCAWGSPPHTSDPYFADAEMAFSNETALFFMSNGSTMRICEHRECSVNRETLRIYGTKGSFENDRWQCQDDSTDLTAEEMRDSLPPEVAEAFRDVAGDSDSYGAHGGSHPYLVHEFVDAVASGRTPAINAWEAARYMAAGVTAHRSALRDGEVLEVPDWGDASRSALFRRTSRRRSRTPSPSSAGCRSETKKARTRKIQKAANPPNARSMASICEDFSASAEKKPSTITQKKP